MGLLSQIRSLFVEDERAPAPVEQRSNDLSVSEWRWWDSDLATVHSGGTLATRDMALSVPAIWDAVNKISQTIASLPFGIFEQTEAGSTPAKRHPVYHLVRIDPTPNLRLYSAHTFRAALMVQACFGDAFVKIHRNGIGRAVELELLDASAVTPFQANSGRMLYLVRRQIGQRYSEETLTSDEILHIKGLTLDGLAGKSVCKVHSESINTSVSAERFGNKFFANGANPSGALIYPQALNQQQKEIAERKVGAKYGGTTNTGKVMVLDGGAKFEKFSISPGEATLNETRNFQVNQAGRIFGVPVPLLQQLDKATLNNMESMGIQFVNLCLRPWAVQVEQEFALKLLTRDELYSERFFFRFNFNGLLRGDTAARGNYYKIALGGPSTGVGFMSVDEVRALENLDKLPNGEGEAVWTAQAALDMQNSTNENNGQDDGTQNNDQQDGEPQASGN